MLDLILFSVFFAHIFSLSEQLEDASDSPYILDFDNLQPDEIRNIESNVTKQKIILTNFPNAIYISLIGSIVKINDNSHKQGFKFYPATDAVFQINITKSQVIKTYSMFMSNTLLTVKFDLQVHAHLTLDLLPSTWTEESLIFDITQYEKLTIVGESEFIPAVVTQMKPVTTYVVGKVKNIAIPRNWKIEKQIYLFTTFPDGSMSFHRVYMTGDQCSITSNLKKITFDILSLRNSTLNAENRTIICNYVLQMDVESYIYASHVKTNEIYIQSNNHSTPRVIGDQIDFNLMKYYYLSDNDPSDIAIIQSKNCMNFDHRHIQVYTKSYDTIAYDIAESSDDTKSIVIHKNKISIFKSVLLSDTEVNITEKFKRFNLNETDLMYEYLSENTNKVYLYIHAENSPVIKLQNISKLTNYWSITNILPETCPTIELEDDGYFDRLIVTKIKINGKINANHISFFAAFGNFTLNTEQISISNLKNSNIISLNPCKIYITLNGTKTFFNETHMISNDFVMKFNPKTEFNFRGKDTIFVVDHPNLTKAEFQGDFVVDSKRPINLKVMHFFTVEVSPNTMIKKLENEGVLKVTGNNFNQDSSIFLTRSGKIRADFKKHFNIRVLVLKDQSVYDNSSISFTPLHTYFSSSYQVMASRISSENIYIDHHSMGYIDSIENVSLIRVLYSVQKSGYLYANRITQNKDKSVFEVSFHNVEKHDQIFSSLDDFTIDIFCAKQFEINVSSINLTFISSHWQFAGDNRLFDMQIRKLTDKTCISLIQKHHDPVSPNKINMNMLIIIGASIAALFIVIIISVISIRFWQKKKKLNSFMTDTCLTDSLLLMSQE